MQRFVRQEKNQTGPSETVIKIKKQIGEDKGITREKIGVNMIYLFMIWNYFAMLIIVSNKIINE